MSDVTYIIHNDDNRKTFEDKDEFDDMVQLLKETDTEFDTETVSNGSDDSQDTSDVEVMDTTEKMKEGYQQVAEGANEDDVPVVSDTKTETLPNRDLQEDPISWLQRGSDEFVTTIKGTPVITKKGFRVLQHKYNISTTSKVIVGPEETEFEYCRVKATATKETGEYAEAHGSAHVKRGDDSFLLLEMADTRAKSRALSDVTGVGAIAIEETYGTDLDK